MFNRTPKEVPKKLEEASISILNEMAYVNPGKENYSELLEDLIKVEALRTPQQERWWQKVNPNNVILVIGNVLGIVVIVAYEQKHVFVSKAQGFILKSQK